MTPIQLSSIHSWKISSSCCIVFFLLWTNAITIIADNHQSEIGAASQIEGMKNDAVLTPKEKRSAEFSPESKEFGEELYNKDSSSFMPMRGKKNDMFQKDVLIDNGGIYGEDKRDLMIGNKPGNLNVEDKRAFYAMRGKKDDFNKRSFFAGTDAEKKDFNKAQNEDKRAFYAMRGKKDSNDEFNEDKRAFYAMRGKKDDLKRAFYAMRGKKGLEELEEEKRAFYAMRGKKDDGKRAFYAMRGKKDDIDEEKRAFYAMRGKKDYYDDNKRAFYAMRGKKDVDDFIDAMRHAYILHQDDEMDDEIKRAAFIPMRGKRNAHSLDLKDTPVLKKKGKFFASRG